MKLLLILPEYGPDVKGGIATFYDHLVPGLLRTGCSVDICVPTQESCTATAAGLAGVGTIFTTDLQRRRAAAQFSHLAAFPDLIRTLSHAFAAWEASNHGNDHDVVEVTDSGLLHAPWLVHADGPPVVVQLHGSDGQLDFYDPFEGNELTGTATRMIETALLGRADELQSGGPQNATDWSRLLNRPVRHIWPALHSDTESVAPSAPFGNDAFGLVVGRIQRWKGPDMLCQALRLLGSRAPKIAWVGRDHPIRRFSQSMSEYLGETYPEVWRQTVIPLGEISRHAVAGIQAAAHFVVVPSNWDVFNLSAAEAMAAGKVVICSEGAGAAWLIEHGRNGFRFSPGDTPKLAELIAMVSTLSVGDRMILGQAAQATVRQELNVDRIAAQRMERFVHLKSSSRPWRGRHSWLDGFFAANDPGLPLGFLDRLPLRGILRYAAKRGMHRLWAGQG